MSNAIVIVIFIALVVFFTLRSSTGRKLAEENIQIGTEFLASNKAVDGVQETASGLQYLRLSAGSGSVHPKANDTVKVHYHGTLIDGTVFDSSVDRGQPLEFGLHQVISGWTEGLQLMVVGEKARLFIPSDLAYGNRSAGIIKPGSTLVFEVELIAIQ